MREALVHAWGEDFFGASDIDFFEDVWVFEGEHQTHKIIWSNLYYGDSNTPQSCLTNRKNVDILAWAKPLFWAMLYHPAPRARPKKPAALGHDLTGLRTLLSWMACRKIRYPNELTSLEIEAYVEALPNLLLADSAAVDEFDIVGQGDQDEETEVGFGWSSFYKRLNLLDIIYSHSEGFAQAGIKPMPETPFPNIGVKTLASRLADKLPGAIPPLQDEIAIPLFNNTANLVVEAIPCVERLVQNERNNAPYEALLSERASWKEFNCSQILDAMLKFEAERIRVPNMPEGLSFLETLKHPKVRMHVTRALVRHYISACAILVQGLLGLRASELLSIRRGIDSKSNLPICVRTEVSNDGLFKVFLLDATLTKMAEGSEVATWTIGAVPVDSTELPIAIDAIICLNRVASQMDFYPDDPERIFFNFRNSGNNEGTRWSVTSRNTASGLARYVKRSIRFFVDFDSLPDQSLSALHKNDLVTWKESCGEIFRPHMLRKTFAQFMYHTDPSLIRGIQLQLQHQSLAMTYGYIGSGQQRSMRTVSDQLLATTVMGIMYGQKPAGRQGRRLYEDIDGYRELVGRSKSVQAWVKVQKHHIENNIRLFSNGRHGYCLPVEPDEMRCHKIAGTTNPAVLGPNLAHRSPDVCSGCSCFVLMANKSDFWIRRYQENTQAALQLATQPLGSNQAKVAVARNIFEQRAKASALLLDQLGIDVRNLPEEEVRNDEKS
ncbi:site-specific integrase [Kordiimonas lacus]|uniref:Phage integrase family protein n=1 Tax=Kordiimonas lacus TaxID=637679 RepID=A0A1G7E0X6_9PROT|nr:site-specific integrase [Kordiimonas lacus]SDE57357.1 hypothetical protein SAMN04488071_3235 [Kordiimonas lacus]